ncbi:MAG: phosphotransferase [Rhodobacteraceae bacterium]|nr:MAG: phosphotransferase [Paracoccaceae bacterium]
MKRIGDAETEAEQAAEAAIGAIPDWAGRAIAYAPLCPDVVSPVHRGVESAIWRVEPDGRAPAVLKVMRDDMRRFFDVDAAIAGARHAAALGVGPEVLWADAALGALATPLLGEGWRTATLADLQEPAVIDAALAATARLQDGPPLAARFDVFDEIRRLDAMAREADVAPPPDGWWLLEAARDMEAALDAAGADLAPCRNDGVSSNVMVGPDGAVMLLDYDRAGMNDACYDVAALLTEACAFPSEAAAVLERRFGRAEPAILNRCVVLGAADDLMNALWAAVSAATSPRRHVEFKKYSEWRYLRCRSAVGDPRFEERLRKL